MNHILLLPDDEMNGSCVRLTGRRLRHVLEVHRANRGDQLAVGLLGGKVGTGTVTLIDRTILEMDVHFDRDPPAALPITVVLALPRPKVLRRVLYSLSVLGVKRIILLNSARVEKSYWQSPFLAPEAVMHQLLLGLEQSRDTVLPEVILKPLFKPFVEDELPDITRGTLALAAHPGRGDSCPRHVSGPVTLAVGPEGGFVPYEIEKLASLGFTVISLGERVLNVETAVPALLSRIF
jgi:RsmE family RNA methyltransferase